MKKTIVTAAIALVVGVVGTPILGMAISPTRDLILGMAPNDAVLQLADKIDQTGNTNEAKIQEMQATIDSQNSKLADQTKQLKDQTAKVESAKVDVKNVVEAVAKNKDCSIEAAKYCGLKQYSDPKEYADFKDYSIKSCIHSGDSSSSCQKTFQERYGINYDNCQKALVCN